MKTNDVYLRHEFVARVYRMKAELIAMAREGSVPVTVESFGELHDHIDANELGGFCEDSIDKLREYLRTPNEPVDDMPKAFADFTNTCQDAIDTWIRCGSFAFEVGLPS